MNDDVIYEGDGPLGLEADVASESTGLFAAPFLLERPVAYHVTPAQPCPYLPDRWERKVWTPLDDRSSDFSGLARGGFRRSHMVAYRPACPRCNACVPVRIRVADFQWSRGMRRIARASEDLEGTWTPARATGEQYVLFQRYLQARHADGEMADMGLSDFRSMIDESPASSALVELRRTGRDGDGRLQGVCLVDRLEDGLSAVYSFFDPSQPKRSLGSYIVLWLVRAAEAHGLPYVYLGYWIGESRKMSYKARFRPLEGLTDGQWRDLQVARGLPGLDVPEAAD